MIDPCDRIRFGVLNENGRTGNGGAWEGRTESEGTVNEFAIYVTERNMETLSRLVDAFAAGRDRGAGETLATELGRATVVAADKIGADVVTMNSTFVYLDMTSGLEREITLVYPRDADPTTGRISVLSPLGTAFLGLSVGQEIEWALPGSRKKRVRIVELRYQPEAMRVGRCGRNDEEDDAFAPLRGGRRVNQAASSG